MPEENGVELYRKHRPQGLKQVVGQDRAVKCLMAMITNKKVPHSLLFTGPSGCGKTTLARILARNVGCVGDDLIEINAADSRGIDTIREIRGRISLCPAFGRSRVWIIDEAAKLSGDAQTGILKVLEECPPHAYLMLATTDPQKLLKTIITRCAEVRVSLLSPVGIRLILDRLCRKEGYDLPDEILDKIAECSGGSGRAAAVTLQQVAHMDPQEALELIEAPEEARDADALVKLLTDRRAKWKDVAKLLNGIESDPEQFRRRILGLVTAQLLRGFGDAGRAMQIINLFRDNWYDCGKAGMVASCYDLVHAGKG